MLLERLAPQQSPAVQIAAVKAMREDRTATVPDALLPRLREMGPTVRAAAIRTLLARSDWTTALLKAMASGAAGRNRRQRDRCG